MQVFFIVFLIIFSVACILVKIWFFNTMYKPWVDSILEEYKSKDEENQLIHDSAEV